MARNALFTLCICAICFDVSVATTPGDERQVQKSASRTSVIERPVTDRPVKTSVSSVSGLGSTFNDTSLKTPKVP